MALRNGVQQHRILVCEHLPVRIARSSDFRDENSLASELPREAASRKSCPHLSCITAVGPPSSLEFFHEAPHVTVGMNAG